MSEQERRPDGERPAEEPPARQETIDLDALTAAVERLLRRDLEIERERLRRVRRG